MYEKQINYPCAVVDDNKEGFDIAIDWLGEHVTNRENLTVWIEQKNMINNYRFLKQFLRVNAVKLVIKIPFDRVDGPVLAVCPHLDTFSYITTVTGMTALAVMRGSEDLYTWIKEVNAEVLQCLEYEDNQYVGTNLEIESELAPEVIAKLKQITLSINHNKTIAAGDEKNIVVKHLLWLRNNGFTLPAKSMAEWAIAHGWTKDNPKELMKLVNRINSGVTPRLSY